MGLNAALLMARVGCPTFGKEEMGHRQEKGQDVGGCPE